SRAVQATGSEVMLNNDSRGPNFAEGEGAQAMSLAGTRNRLSNEGRIEARGESVIAVNTEGYELTVTNLAGGGMCRPQRPPSTPERGARQSTRLNSSHVKISYAGSCSLKETG